MGLFSSRKPAGLRHDRYPGEPGEPKGSDLIEGRRPCIWCFTYFRPASSGERFCCPDHAEKAAQS